MSYSPDLVSRLARQLQCHWPAVLVASALLFHCSAVSPGKPMWMDEVLTWYAASMPAPGQLLDMVNDKINVGHQAYFFAVWLWSGLFSGSALSLRLFSSLGMCVAMVFTWLTLRRACGFWPSAVAISLVFCSAQLVLWQSVEARFYGMLLAAAAMLLYLVQASREQRRFRWPTALGLFALNGLLPLVHVFGFLYSAIFIAAVYVYDRVNGYLRPWHYLSSIAGWLMFVPFIPAFRKQLELSEPHYWIRAPSVPELLRLYGNGHWYLSFLAMVVVVVVLLRVRRAYTGGGDFKRSARNAMLPLLALGFLGLPASLWLQSQVGQPLFMPRYVILFELGWAIVLALGLARLLPRKRDIRPAERSALGGLVIVIVASLVVRGIDTSRRELTIPTAELLALSGNVPVVTDDTHFYLQASWYHPELREFYFVLDWPSALASPVPNDTQDYQAMQALRRHVPGLGIVEGQYLLATFPEFVVYRSRHWLTSLAGNEKLRFQPIAPDAVRVSRAVPNAAAAGAANRDTLAPAREPLAKGT